jgi:predicted permease
MRRLFTRLVAFVTRPSDARLRQEIEEHIELETADNIRAGLPPVEARRQALLKFGSVESIRGQYRDEQSLPMLELLAQDTRYALRQLRRAPAFALTAVLTLALGIGVNTAMFTVIHGVLLTDLPYPDSARLLRLVQAHNTGDVTMAEYQFVQAHGRALASVAAYRGAGERRIGAPQDQIWIPTLYVSTHFLRTLGVQPQIGREFTEDDTAPSGPASLILSDDVWRRAFGSDPAILGRSIPLGASSATVIGVLPPGFWFPQPVSVLLPLRSTGSLSDTGTNTQLIARLAPGAGITQAQAELSAMTEQLRDAARGSLASQYRGLAAMPLRDWLVGDVRMNLLLLFAATGVLLLIACGNLALLLLARFAARTREVAVRAALGSSRARLLTQFLTENVIVTAFGAAAGVAAAHALVRVFLAASPFDLPASAPIAVSPIALVFTVLSALATAVFVTWAPFLGTARLNVPACLRSENKNVGAGVIRARTRNTFIVAEVALSTVLLVAAGLLVQTLYRTNSEHLGFVPEHVLTFQTPLAPERARNAQDRVAFTRALLERLERTPGVAAAAATNLLPLMGQSNLPTERDGHPDRSIGGMEVRAGRRITLRSWVCPCSAAGHSAHKTSMAMPRWS